MDARLEARLRAADVRDLTDPVEAWRRLRAAEGARATVIDLYALAASLRGLAPHDLPRAERYALARSVLPDMWPAFETTAGSDRVDEPVTVADYDPGWPQRYASWRDRLRTALGATAERIEHVGSTAVPGLPAKPVVDIQVSVADLEDEEAYVPALAGVDLQLRSRDVHHRYFRPLPHLPRDVHVHVCAVGSAWEADHLRFRDHLRADPSARDRYAESKRAAARVWADDRLAYTDAKTEVILEILGNAR